MHYSTESQIHINPASWENLSFISDRNLRKGQGTAPPGLHNYAVIIVLSHASPTLPTLQCKYEVAAAIRRPLFPGSGSDRAEQIPPSASSCSTSENYSCPFLPTKRLTKLAFLF